MQQVFEYNTDDVSMAKISDDLYQGRRAYAEINDNGMGSDVTISVQGYNRIEKVKRAVDSILRNAADVNYDLLLIDNGSTDGTFEFFKSIPYERKRIIRLSKNVSAYYPVFFQDISWYSRYLVGVNDDVILTPGSIRNLIRVADSDPRIGLVQPVCSNISGAQQVDLDYSDFDEMERKAVEYNVSDPAKWHERVRMVMNGTLMKKECVYAIGYPIDDPGFFHDFADDDVAFRVRRAGYKAVLAKDTWICHDHPQNSSGYTDMKEHERSLIIGRKNFRDKYFGVDAWDDVNNFIPEYLSAVRKPGSERPPRILGVDVKCGTPILEIKNHLRSFGIFDAECRAYTRKGKYFIDLQTVCGAENVFSGPIECISSSFDKAQFDYAVIGDDINTYQDPFGVIKSVLSLVKKGGQLFISLRNTNDVIAFLQMIGRTDQTHEEHALDISLDELIGGLRGMSVNAGYLQSRLIAASQEIISFVSESLQKISAMDERRLLGMFAKTHYLVIEAE